MAIRFPSPYLPVVVTTSCAVGVSLALQASQLWLNEHWQLGTMDSQIVSAAQ